MSLSSAQIEIHQKALAVSRGFKDQQWQLIEVLQKVDDTKLFRKLGCSSLFVYAVKLLDLDESVAYSFIKAARLSRQIPRLEQSLREQKLSVAKAARIFSALNSQNAEELIAFAESHSAAEINREVGRIHQRDGLPQKLRKLQVSEELFTKIKRIRSVLNKDLERALGQVLDESLDRHDPVRKAQRAVKRAETPPQSTISRKFCTYRKPEARQPLTAAQKHKVFARDGGRCTHRDAEGQRCPNERFLHIHHIRPVSQGGSNEPNNLTTLCSFHHDLVHQLSLPLEGQVTWLREPRASYG